MIISGTKMVTHMVTDNGEIVTRSGLYRLPSGDMGTHQYHVYSVNEDGSVSHVYFTNNSREAISMQSMLSDSESRPKDVVRYDILDTKD